MRFPLSLTFFLSYLVLFDSEQRHSGIQLHPDLVRFALAVFSGMLSAALFLPSFRFARIFEAMDKAKWYYRSLAVLNVALPAMIVICWIKPLTRDALVSVSSIPASMCTRNGERDFCFDHTKNSEDIGHGALDLQEVYCRNGDEESHCSCRGRKIRRWRRDTSP